MSIHEQIVEQYAAYLKEHAAWEDKGVKAAATRARSALGDLGKLKELHIYEEHVKLVASKRRSR